MLSMLLLSALAGLCHAEAAVAAAAQAGDGIVVRGDGGLHVARGGTLSLSGTLEADGTIVVRGRLEIGRDLRLCSARFEDGSELAFSGGRPHRLDVPADLALWNVSRAGRLEGELRPVLGARGGPGPELRDGEGDTSIAAGAAWTAAAAEGGSRATGASAPLDIAIIGRTGTRAAGNDPPERGPPIV